MRVSMPGSTSSTPPTPTARGRRNRSSAAGSPSAADGGEILPWSALAGGLLGGALQKLTEGRRGAERVTKLVERHRDQLEAWEALCGELGEAPADIALAWLLHQPAVTAPIIGPRTMEQFQGSRRALDVTLEPDTLDALDKIFPGPGGPAPEAYAW